MNKKGIIVLLVLAVFTALLVVNLADNVSTYTDFKTAEAKTGQEVHIVASWVRREEAKYNPANDQFSFYLQDSSGRVQLVQYNDPQPANFEQAQKVVVIGKMDGQVFQADKILMKCPSKYNEGKLETIEVAPNTQPIHHQENADSSAAH